MLKRTLICIDHFHIESNSNIDQNIDFISKVITDASEKSVPHKIVTIRPNDFPWINCSIRRLIRKRKRAYKKCKKTINNHYWETYKHFRNNCVSEIREAKKSYYDNLERLLSTEKLNSKLFFFGKHQNKY